jgi:hypothetical protein
MYKYIWNTYVYSVLLCVKVRLNLYEKLLRLKSEYSKPILVSQQQRMENVSRRIILYLLHVLEAFLQMNKI